MNSQRKINRIVANYFKVNGFQHTYFLFMKEADIGGDDEDDEDLVQILQQSLLYMKEEKELMKDFLPIDYFTSDLSDIENSTVFDINMISFDDFCKIDQKLRNGEISIRVLCKQFRCGHS